MILSKECIGLYSFSILHPAFLRLVISSIRSSFIFLLDSKLSNRSETMEKCPQAKLCWFVLIFTLKLFGRSLTFRLRSSWGRGKKKL